LCPTLIFSSDSLQIRRVVNDRTDVYMDALEGRAKDLNIYDLKPFYQSALFRNHGLRVNELTRIITKIY
jgi:hydrogenase maturation factor